MNSQRPKTARELREHYRRAFRGKQHSELMALLEENMGKLMAGERSAKEGEAVNRAVADCLKEIRAR